MYIRKLLSVPYRITKLVALALGLCCALAAASCSQEEVATPKPVVVEVAGATSMLRVLEDLSLAFSAQHPGVLIELRGGGSTIGETRVLNGRTELGASTLIDDTPDELPQDVAGVASRAATAQSAADQLQRAPIGIDAIAVIVNSRNPVEQLTSEELRDLYSGRIFSWEQLNGIEGDVQLVSREDGSGARAAFESRIMDDSAVSLTALVMPTSQDVVDYVAKNPYAVGYVSTAFTPLQQTDHLSPTAASDSDSPIRVIAVDGVLPSDATVSSQEYALIQPLYLVTDGAPSGWPKQFIDFALSPTGQEIVNRYHTPVR